MKETNERSYHGIWFIPADDRNCRGHLEVSDYYIQLLLTDPNFGAFDNIERETIVYPFISSRQKPWLYFMENVAIVEV